MAQLETKDPEPTSFLYTRSSLPYKNTHATLAKDPCNHPENFKCVLVPFACMHQPKPSLITHIYVACLQT